mmetsp:Transcript_6448/g.17246  ORF Transcript_6448/g.17246 Transcript_6448/m.17246 type:complete len:291 (-) Transcript_6448:637-1509(-)
MRFRVSLFALSSSWSSSSTRLFARLLVMPCSSSSSCFARASAFSLAIVAAFFSKATVSNMFGMTVQQTRRKYSTSTSPLASGHRMLRIRWICIRERHSWSALSSTPRSSQMDMTGSCCIPKRRHSRMRWVLSCWTSVSTSALWSASTRSFCSSSTKSSYGTCPKSSSLHICISICTSCIDSLSPLCARDRRNSNRERVPLPPASKLAKASRAARAASSISSPKQSSMASMPMVTLDVRRRSKSARRFSRASISCGAAATKGVYSILPVSRSVAVVSRSLTSQSSRPSGVA